jgi:hypothetical protein
MGNMKYLITILHIISSLVFIELQAINHISEDFQEIDKELNLKIEKIKTLIFMTNSLSFSEKEIAMHIEQITNYPFSISPVDWEFK